ncbi:MAG: hypothetical protein Q4P10_04320 [Methanomassiliicoccales archaeon]|nr:hypothetical protein [Methanomassiliicoccales archaeon]
MITMKITIPNSSEIVVNGTSEFVNNLESMSTMIMNIPAEQDY